MDPRLYRSILVPLDGSAAADAALSLALRLVAPAGEIVVSHVINRALVVAQCITPYGGDPMPAIEAIESDQRDIFGKAAARAQAANIRITAVALDGELPASILALAKERKVDAIAMGTHGRSGLERMLLGNTAAAVLRHAELPTFVLHEQCVVQASEALRHIVVALDTTPAAVAAARAATDLAVRDAGRVTFAHVAERGDGERQDRALAEAIAYARASGVESNGAILHGEPARAVIDYAQRCHAGLIAVGTRGPTGAPFGMGSTAQAIARTSSVPVLVVPASVPHALNPQTPAEWAHQPLGSG